MGKIIKRHNGSSMGRKGQKRSVWELGVSFMEEMNLWRIYRNSLNYQGPLDHMSLYIQNRLKKSPGDP